MIIVLSGGAAGGEQVEQPDSIKVGTSFVYNGANYRYDGDDYAVYTGDVTEG